MKPCIGDNLARVEQFSMQEEGGIYIPSLPIDSTFKKSNKEDGGKGLAAYIDARPGLEKG
jgi:hypothetical protein